MTMQNAVFETAGVDVTSLVGSGVDPQSAMLFEDFKAAREMAEEHPCVNTFRTCVEAFDRWQAQFITEGN